MLFDTHAHFDTFEQEGTVHEVLDRAVTAGVTRLCAVGSTVASNQLVTRLARERPDVLIASVGYDRDQAGQSPDLRLLEEQAASPGVAAVGEIGLDYHYSPETAPEQRSLFETMLDFAVSRRLPVVVHSRDADEDTLRLLEAFSMQWKNSFHTMEKSVPHGGKIPPPGILHCFTGDLPFAEALLSLGFMISFSGIISFNNAGPLREVARHIPEDRLLIETDCPYLTPKPFRGKVNEPAYVAQVAQVLAEVRAVPVKAVALTTFANAEKLFQLKGES